MHNQELLDQVTGPGGALEALVRAREEGMVGEARAELSADEAAAVLDALPHEDYQSVYNEKMPS